MNDIKDARSVYLNYKYTESILYHNEILVEKSCYATYFCVCGFHLGYLGIQQHNSDKIALFSVWDSKDNNPNITPKDKQVYAIASNPAAIIKRFGGEGSGIQCIYEYAWDINKIYQFEIRVSNIEDDRVNYSAFVKKEFDKKWIHLATYSCLTKIPYIKGFYSFVEDFGRDGRTPNLQRAAQYINGFSVDQSNIKSDFRKAKFTAVNHPLNNINAELLNNGFRLITGGNTIQKTPLNTILQY